MCGIAGILGPSVSSLSLDHMTDSLTHRGPDGRGTWVDSLHEIGLGHRRLSIIDLSEAGKQPMSGANGRLQIVFNGEIYNYRELRAELRNYPYRSHSDTEVILAAYERWGRQCVERFNGMFAFALWDDDRRELFCARDRLGVKPFFYAHHNGQLLFGSEVKAILAAGYPAQPDRITWFHYLVYGAYENQDGSFFSGIESLPPGHIIVAKPQGKTEILRYWSLPDRASEPLLLSESEAAEELQTHLDNAVALRLRSDVPVALNLSGGLDSSSVAQSFFRQSDPDQGIHIFTACFDDPRYDEDEFANRVIEGVRCTRHIARLSPKEVPELAASAMYSQEAPFGGIGTLAYQRAHTEIQRNGLKVALEGQGGDELFAGYAYFEPIYVLDLMEQGAKGEAESAVRAMRDPDTVMAMAQRVRQGTTQVYQDGTEYLAPQCIDESFIVDETMPEYPEPYSSRLGNALFRDLTCTKLPRVLRMNDRLAMAYGVELRQPFLDYRLVEFAFRMPSYLKIAKGYGKYILRRAMADRLPRDIVWTRKRPVVTPQREWMVGPLRPWVEDIIKSRSFAQRGLFNVDQVRRTFTGYLDGHMNNAFPIWQWINAELWHRAFVDCQPS